MATPQSAFMHGVGSLVMAVSAVAMIFLAPVLAAKSQPYVQEAISRYDYDNAQKLLTAFEIAVWPICFYGVRGVLSLILLSLGLAIVKRSFD